MKATALTLTEHDASELPAIAGHAIGKFSRMAVAETLAVRCT